MVRSGSILECIVSEALLTTDRISQAIFEVEDMNGIITLKGTVASLQDRLTAEVLVRQQSGVVDVINNLWVTSFFPEEYEKAEAVAPEAVS